MTSYEAKVTSKGQITLPAPLREALRISAGDKVVFSVTPDGAFRVTAQNKSLADLKGIVRTGPKFTGDDVRRWLEESREERAGFAPKKRK
jgi:AbrB family looped-hinge helix DNA binding protein